MTGMIYDWMKNLVFYFIIVSMIMNVLPDSKYQKYIRFFLGMVLIVLVINPVLKVFHLDKTLDEHYFAESVEREWEETMQDIDMKVGP